MCDCINLKKKFITLLQENVLNEDLNIIAKDFVFDCKSKVHQCSCNYDKEIKKEYEKMNHKVDSLLYKIYAPDCLIKASHKCYCSDNPEKCNSINHECICQLTQFVCIATEHDCVCPVHCFQIMESSVDDNDYVVPRPCNANIHACICYYNLDVTIEGDQKPLKHPVHIERIARYGGSCRSLVGSEHQCICFFDVTKCMNTDEHQCICMYVEEGSKYCKAPKDEHACCCTINSDLCTLITDNMQHLCICQTNPTKCRIDNDSHLCICDTNKPACKSKTHFY
jgi:hypothetical protein